MKPKAVILLSGGLDSAVTLFFAKSLGYELFCINFDYGQRHAREMASASILARKAGAVLKTVKVDFPWKGSSLIDKGLKIPTGRKIDKIKKGGIPSTYVPARNTVFLSLAASFAEVIGADSIFIGAHFEDSSGYPDCRKVYLEAFEKVLKTGTKRGIDGRLKLEFPLIDISKKDIIRLGKRLSVPFEYTWSCYKGARRPCMECDSCVLRAKGFSQAGMPDPLVK